MVVPDLGSVLGGIQKDMVCLAREFAGQGDQVEFVTTYNEFPEGRVDPCQPLTYKLPRGVRITRLAGRLRSRLRGFQPANPPLWLPWLSRTVLDARPDLVIFFNIGWPLTVLPALLAIRRHATVLYQTAYHAPLLWRPLDPARSHLKLQVAALAHHLIPHSHFEKGQIVRDGGVAEDQITVVYPGVEVRSLEEGEIEAFRARYGLCDKVVVSHVARLSAFKGTDKLLRILPQVRAETGRDVVLLLVGRNTEGDSLGRVMSEVGIGTEVRFTGPVSERDLHLAYEVSDVFALPSEYESFGFVFLEAMSHGVPVIGVRTGGVPEVIRDGETGYVLDAADDLPALTARLAALIADDPLRGKMGVAARNWARTEFNWADSAAAVKRVALEVKP
jgi:glycosyltransferase involved in cell wall biosynthesis